MIRSVKNYASMMALVLGFLFISPGSAVFAEENTEDVPETEVIEVLNTDNETPENEITDDKSLTLIPDVVNNEPVSNQTDDVLDTVNVNPDNNSNYSENDYVVTDDSNVSESELNAADDTADEVIDKSEQKTENTDQKTDVNENINQNEGGIEQPVANVVEPVSENTVQEEAAAETPDTQVASEDNVSDEETVQQDDEPNTDLETETEEVPSYIPEADEVPEVPADLTVLSTETTSAEPEYTDAAETAEAAAGIEPTVVMKRISSYKSTASEPVILAAGNDSAAGEDIVEPKVPASKMLWEDSIRAGALEIASNAVAGVTGNLDIAALEAVSTVNQIQAMYNLYKAQKAAEKVLKEVETEEVDVSLCMHDAKNADFEARNAVYEAALDSEDAEFLAEDAKNAKTYEEALGYADQADKLVAHAESQKQVIETAIADAKKAVSASAEAYQNLIDQYNESVTHFEEQAKPYMNKGQAAINRSHDYAVLAGLIADRRYVKYEQEEKEAMESHAPFIIKSVNTLIARGKKKVASAVKSVVDRSVTYSDTVFSGYTAYAETFRLDSSTEWTGLNYIDSAKEYVKSAEEQLDQLTQYVDETKKFASKAREYAEQKKPESDSDELLTAPEPSKAQEEVIESNVKTPVQTAAVSSAVSCNSQKTSKRSGLISTAFSAFKRFAKLF